MTRLRPPGAGPGPRALLGATALGALLVTALALAFGALVARSGASPRVSDAVAPRQIGAQLAGAGARGDGRDDDATPILRAGAAGWRSSVVVLDRGAGTSPAGVRDGRPR